MDDLSPNDKPSQSQQGLKRRGRPRLANAEGDPTAVSITIPQNLQSVVSCSHYSATPGTD